MSILSIKLLMTKYIKFYVIFLCLSYFLGFTFTNVIMNVKLMLSFGWHLSSSLKILLNCYLSRHTNILTHWMKFMCTPFRLWYNNVISSIKFLQYCYGGLKNWLRTGRTPFPLGPEIGKRLLWKFEKNRCAKIPRSIFKKI